MTHRTLVWLPLGAGLGALLLCMVVAGRSYLRPVPPAIAVQSFSTTSSWGGPPVRLPWPSQGEAAIGVQGLGLIGSTSRPSPKPIAGIAKVMTAMITLEARPLTGGQQGPEITVTDADQQAYRSAADNGESVVPVETGEGLTEYQALQALLIGAGNNIAPFLARWVAGSEARFVQLMNARARQLSLQQTTFADSGGISPQTVSVPADLIRLGEAAMANPVLAEIVGQKQATLPLMGPVSNFDTAIGQSGIVGIKSGNLPSGASFLFAGSEQVTGGQMVMVYGAVLGLPGPSDTFSAARALLDTARANLRTETIVRPGQVVGRYETGWGGSAPIVATQPLAVLVWPGTVVTARLDVRSLTPPVRTRTPVGTFHVNVNVDGHGQEVPVVVSRALHPPSTRWRFQRGPI